MGTMAVMAELHQMQDLKLNLKFEVEVLCNTLSLDLKVIKLFALVGITILTLSFVKYDNNDPLNTQIFTPYILC